MAGSEIHESGQTPEKVSAAFRKAAEQQMAKAMLLVQGQIQRRTPFRTGTLRRSITSLVEVGADGTITGKVGTNVFYGEYLDRGTGLYGPKHHVIVPVHAQALAWPAGGTASVRGGNGRMLQGSGGPGFTLAGRRRKGSAGAAANMMVRRSVKGVKPMRFFEEGVAAAEPDVLGMFAGIASVATEVLSGREGPLQI